MYLVEFGPLIRVRCVGWGPRSLALPIVCIMYREGGLERMREVILDSGVGMESRGA